MHCVFYFLCRLSLIIYSLVSATYIGPVRDVAAKLCDKYNLVHDKVPCVRVTNNNPAVPDDLGGGGGLLPA